MPRTGWWRSGWWTTPPPTARPRWCASSFRGSRLIASQENVGYGAAVNMVAERTQTRLDRRRQRGHRGQAGRRPPASRRGSRPPRRGVARPAPRAARRLDPALRSSLSHAVARGRLQPGPSPAQPPLGRPALHRGLLGSVPAARRWTGRWPRSCSPAATAWDEIGGFDPAQWMHAEDLDIAWRHAPGGLAHALRAGRRGLPRGQRRIEEGVRRRAHDPLHVRQLRLAGAPPWPGHRASHSARQLRGSRSAPGGAGAARADLRGPLRRRARTAAATGWACTAPASLRATSCSGVAESARRASLSRRAAPSLRHSPLSAAVRPAPAEPPRWASAPSSHARMKSGASAP